MTKPCNRFGVGYQFNHETCRSCNKSDECLQSTIKEGIGIQQGEKPNIPYAKKKKQCHIYVGLTSKVNTMPFGTNKAIKIEVFLDLEWLKKHFGKEPEGGVKK